MGEKILFGLQVAAIGMITVFILLAVLIGFIYLFSYIINLKNKMPVKNSAKKDGAIDPKVIAAITASINCFNQTSNTSNKNGSSIEFIVKNIKRR